MKLTIIHIVSILLIAQNISAQRTYETNVWNSIQCKKSIQKFGLTFDVGFRTCDEFLHRKRTALIRGLGSYNWKNHEFGIGYAYFEHFNSSKTTESRPFIHYSFLQKSKTFNAKLQFRIRNEFRSFCTGSNLNRLRAQLYTEWMEDRAVSPIVMIELFHSNDVNKLFEQRYMVGSSIDISSLLKLNLFYQLQYQSTVNYGQHIIGWQIRIELD